MTADAGVVASDKPYAKCQECSAEFADRDAVSAHGRDTMTPTGEAGIVARGHRVSIVNPTEAEQRASRVRMRIEDALQSAYEDLYELVEKGDFTAAEVAAEMWVFDLRDGWDDYVAEGDDS